MDEIWKPVPGYEGLYEISDHGNMKSYVKSKKGREMHFGGAGGDRSHPNVCITKDYEHCSKYVYILEWETFNGPIPEGYVVHHKDGDPNNNFIENLELMERGEHGAEHLSKQVLQIDLKTGEAVKEWRSGREARREYGDGVMHCLRGRSNSAYGFGWKYKV